VCACAIMGPAAAAPATSVMNSRRLMCSPWCEGSHAIISLRGMPRCRGGDALSHRRFIDYPARPPPDAHALRPDALPQDIHPACGIPRSEVSPSDTPPSDADTRAPHDPPGNTPEVCVAPGRQALRLAEEGFRRTGSARGCGMLHREGRHGPALEMATIAAGGGAPRCRFHGQR